MKCDKYVLNEQGEPVPQPDLYEWAMWFEKSRRTVKCEQIGDYRVSTVFLGLDHNFDESGPPVLWETMVFGGKLDQEQDHCSGNREQAEAMHERMVKKVKEMLCNC